MGRVAAHAGRAVGHAAAHALRRPAARAVLSRVGIWDETRRCTNGAVNRQGLPAQRASAQWLSWAGGAQVHVCRAGQIWVRKLWRSRVNFHTGSWCSGITSASYAEGPGFKSQWVQDCHRRGNWIKSDSCWSQSQSLIQFTCSRVVSFLCMAVLRVSSALGGALPHAGGVIFGVVGRGCQLLNRIARGKGVVRWHQTLLYAGGPGFKSRCAHYCDHARNGAVAAERRFGLIDLQAAPAVRQRRAHPDLNQGPADLQSAALTTELCTQMLKSRGRARFCAAAKFV